MGLQRLAGMGNARPAALLAMSLAGLQPAGAGQDFAGPVAARVVEVLDGDTFVADAHVWPGQTVRVNIRIRGIDAPEMKSRCVREHSAAIEAREVLAGLLEDGEVSISISAAPNITAGCWPMSRRATVRRWEKSCSTWDWRGPIGVAGVPAGANRARSRTEGPRYGCTQPPPKCESPDGWSGLCCFSFCGNARKGLSAGLRSQLAIWLANRASAC